MKTTTAKLTGRRNFLRSTAGSLACGLGASFWADETLDAAPQNTNTNSKPSDLKITDLRVAVVTKAPMTCPLIRIDTNQGIYGLGEVRDGASKTYALFLKSRLLGENPCNVDKIFRKIKQFGFHSRQAGGVCGVEMALWDLAGKAYNVPVHQMIGGKFRDTIRCYADTTESEDPQVYGHRLKLRKDQGFTWLKMDLGIDLLRDKPGMLSQPLGQTPRETFNKQHFFTGIELTDKGVAAMADYVAQVREIIGMDVPLSADHFGHIGVNSCIRLGKALQKYNMAWLEDMIPWQYTDLWKKITDAVDVPTLTGEDIYLKGVVHRAGEESCGGYAASRSGHFGRNSRDQKNRRCDSGVRRADVHALCGDSGLPFAWRTSTARRPRRTSWCWKIIQWMCRGGATWSPALRSPSSTRDSSRCRTSRAWESS